MSWNPDNFYLSQSTYKAFQDAVGGLDCPVLFKHKFVTGTIEDEPDDTKSDAIRLGQYFEYVATGGLPRSGVVPEPDRYTRNGPGFEKGQLKKDWLHAQQQAERFRQYCKHFGASIVDVQFLVQDHVNMMEGTGDVILSIPRENWDAIVGNYQENGYLVTDDDVPQWEDCTWESQGTIHYGCVWIDLKYTGLMDDKWNDLGWHPDFLQDKDRLLIQAQWYMHLGQLPFFFWLFSSKTFDSRMIRVKMAEYREDAIVEQAAKVRAKVKAYMLTRFRANPAPDRCEACPLKAECADRFVAPIPHVVRIG